MFNFKIGAQSSWADLQEVYDENSNLSMCSAEFGALPLSALSRSRQALEAQGLDPDFDDSRAGVNKLIKKAMVLHDSCSRDTIGRKRTRDGFEGINAKEKAPTGKRHKKDSADRPPGFPKVELTSEVLAAKEAEEAKTDFMDILQATQKRMAEQKKSREDHRLIPDFEISSSPSKVGECKGLKNSAIIDAETTPSRMKFTVAESDAGSCGTIPCSNIQSSKTSPSTRSCKSNEEKDLGITLFWAPTVKSKRRVVSKNHDTRPKPPTKAQIAKRQVQINLGKGTDEYQRYINAVPKTKRLLSHPRSPDVTESISKRRFDGKIRQWRRKLHELDRDPLALPPAQKKFQEDSSTQALNISLETAVKKNDGGRLNVPMVANSSLNV